jgi:hypothetical protein
MLMRAGMRFGIIQDCISMQTMLTPMKTALLSSFESFLRALKVCESASRCAGLLMMITLIPNSMKETCSNELGANVGPLRLAGYAADDGQQPDQLTIATSLRAVLF